MEKGGGSGSLKRCCLCVCHGAVCWQQWSPRVLQWQCCDLLLGVEVSRNIWRFILLPSLHVPGECALHSRGVAASPSTAACCSRPCLVCDGA
jgi:hypothetical protein